MAPSKLSRVFIGILLLKYGYCSPRAKLGLGVRQGCLHVNTSTHRLVDGLQRERYFHGVNVVVKGPPWMPNITGPFDPFWSFVDEDMQLLYDNGLNGLRYGMMWPGVETLRGKYNMKYIEAANSIVKKAGEDYGIYTLLDMHQDLLSEKFCGEGIPDWAVETGNSKGFPWPLDAPYKIDPKTGYPTPQDCAKHSWGLYQFTEAASVAYQSLYDNVNGTRDSCANFWATVAESFADSPYVIGYDIFNEPWAGDVFSDPLLLVPKVADRKNLAKFYEAIHTQLRKKDDCHNFFFESITWDETEVGFESVPGGDMYANRSVVSFHFYTPPELSRTLEFSARERDAKRLNCASFLSEFSMLDEETMNTADNYLQSWLGWDYKGYVDITGSGNVIWFSNGTRNEAALDMISRTYAQVVSGVTTKMYFDPKTKAFTLQYYISRTCVDNTTTIYLNEARHYSNGYTVKVNTSPNVGGLEWKSLSKNYIQVLHSSTVPERTLITVNISKN